MSRLPLSSRITSTYGWTYYVYNPQALYLDWPKSKATALSLQINQLIQKIEGLPSEVMIDHSIGFHSCMIYFDPRKNHHQEIIDIIENIDVTSTITRADFDTLIIPTNFSTSSGLDLSEVADYCGLTSDEVIDIFCSREYTVHFMGFMPGFIYMGGLDDRLTIPRKASPRTRVPAGSVAIAAGQTGIYPIASPGGWSIIGSTSKTLFDPHLDPPSSVKAGTKVRFTSIS